MNAFTIFDPNKGDVPLATALAQTPVTGQTQNSPTIVGGTANGLALGGTTPAAAAVTTLNATGLSTLSTTQISCLTAGSLGNFATATVNGVALVSCQVGTVTANSVAMFGLKTAGGTVGTPKMATAFEPSTGKFCIASTASDTSTYNIAVLG
jgi:hypothetical protein